MIASLFFIAAFVFFLFIWPHTRFTSRITVTIGLVLMPVGLVMAAATVLWAIKLLRKPRPALVVGYTGLVVGFGFYDPFELPWDDVKSVELRSGAQAQGVSICVVPRDMDGCLKHVGLLTTWSAIFAGPDILKISLLSLDTPWETIKASVNEMSERHQKYVQAKRGIEEWQRKREAEMRITVANYQEQFRRAPIGHWGPAHDAWMPSPVDQAIVFYKDGTGIVTSGPFHHEVDFEWEEDIDWRIRVRPIQSNTPPWSLLSFDLAPLGETGLIAHFNIEETEESQIEFDEFYMIVVLGGMAYTGPVKDSDSARTEE